MLDRENLRPYQRIGIDHMIKHRRCGFWAGMGMGKTATVLTALDTLNLVEDVFPALVLAPLRVAQSTWPDEPAKWNHLKHLRVSAVLGGEGDGAETLAHRMAALRTPADIYTINYEQIPWLVGLYGKKWPFKTIVSDESTKLKNHRMKQGGKRTQNLAAVAHKYSARFIELTGTPSPNGLKDLWGQIWFLDQGERLGRTYDTFKQRWFQRSFTGYGMDPLHFAQAEIEEKLQDICVSVNPKDYFNVDDPIEVPVYIDLPPAARKLYNDMERNMFMEIQRLGVDERAEVEAFNAASRTGKCLQLVNGAAYINGSNKEWEEVHTEKIKALESIVEEAAGAPLLVAYHFKSDLARLLEAFPQGRHLDKKAQTVRDWCEGRIPILFAHPASAGHGLNLQDGGHHLVFFGHNWNLEEYEQIIERIGPVRQFQSGHDRNVFIYHIIARRTVEEDVMERIKTKASVQQILLEAMKARTQ